jgi:hypothetical protein
MLPEVICEVSLSAADPESAASLDSSPGSKLCLRNYVGRDSDYDLAFFTCRIANNEGVDSIGGPRLSFAFPPADHRETILGVQLDRPNVRRQLIW